ncbi:DNA topoisomerase I [Mycosarcoma maydis]|uniref:DNA topoisomerase 1 n=1 Tax=Mycosarcoma maydis TaxID=5270 RepID=TOP1_MYCMD|nr:DNA topoisomerase I [Ustilago maydis 521]P41511.2 RecName: Full=DNA topoisomerase 1; AltName: Full=DNA topoisomerase I [Ustilago maydis 521]KIS70027.1 DNA topoisomerase I [Ustilago maydis 521]|eukprot:XP_011388171.1 DNA topoisomerase I [Ustilago maydis 521]
MNSIQVKNEPMLASFASTSTNGKAKRSAKPSLFSGSEVSSDDDEEKPLAKRPKVEDSDSDAPLTSTVSSQNGVQKRSGSSNNDDNDDDSDSDSDAPLTALVKKSNGSDDDEDDDDDDDEGDDDDEEDDDDDDDDDDKPLSKSSKSNRKPPKTMSITGSGEKKWDVLIHKGPRFPDPYQPLPKDVKLKYDGRPVDLPWQTEEIAMFYAVKLETQHAQNAIFNRNFFDDFKTDLKKYPPRDGTQIKSFDKLDFRDMYNYWRSLKDAELERKKALAPSARKREIEERKAEETKWKICLVDGVEQRVGNVNVEPPGLFLGRGAHPKAGKVKRRISPGDITINHSADHPAPQPPAGMGDWAEVVEKKDVTWLAYWKENINGQYKYVFLDATSNFKTNSDREKFEKARKLDTVVKQIRRDVNKNLKSKVRHERQIATIVWLIDNFSLRAGNEKGEDEAETYGVCSLRCEHAQIKMPDTIHLEFLGKDSMKFEEDLKITNPDVFKNIAMFLKSNGMKDKSGNYVRKKPSDPIFCAPESGSGKMQPLQPNSVNQFLSKYMKGLSAKVFRTYNASVTFQGLLEQTEEWLKSRPNAAEREINQTNLRLAYNEANRQVAILCNHQKTVNPMLLNRNLERTQDKIFQIRYEIMKEQQKILTFHKVSELKKEFKVKEHPFMKQFDKIMQKQDLDAEKVKQYEEQMISDKKSKLESTFKRQQSELQYQLEQKGLTGDDGTPKKGKKAKNVEEEVRSSIKGFKDKKQVDEELKALNETAKRLEKERKTNKSQATSCNFVSSAKKILSKYEMIKKQEAELVNKNNTSDVALSTSKLNYIDPRITLAWLKEWDDRLSDLGQGKAAPKKKVKKEEEENDIKPKKKDAKGAASKKRAAKTGLANSTGDSEKMELGLQVMNISQFFANALQKKFKWAASGDDGRDISAKWVFVKDAQSKMRKLDSAERKGQKGGSMAAMTDAADSKEAQPKVNCVLKKQTSADRKMSKPIKAVDKTEESDDDLSSDSSDDEDKPLAAVV